MNGWAQGSVAVVGAGGMLASDLVPKIREQVRLAGGSVLSWSHSDLDITNRPSVLAQIQDARPTVVINCAAYTDVDGCETHAARALDVNGVAPGHLAEACKVCNSLLVHFSTDFVFDGRARQPYRIDAFANPLSVYGASKLKGEEAILSSGCRCIVIRTSWLYGLRGKNFVEAILQRAQRGESLKVVNDQTGRPTYTADLCVATLQLLDAQACGITHFSNSGQCSWHEFAVEIIRQSGLNVPVATMSSSELGRPAKRPAFSVLDLSEYEKFTGTAPPHWKTALAEYLNARTIGGQAA